MMSRLLGPDASLFTMWLTLTLSAMLIYFVLAGLSYIVVFVLGRRHFHPAYVADPQKDRRARRMALIGLSGNVVLSMPFHALVAGGHSRIYWDISGPQLPWLLVSSILYVAFVDAAIYWIHRGLHNNFFFRHTHRFHHEWRVPNSWTSMAFHPFDSFALSLPVHLFGFLLPLNGYVYLFMQGVMSLWSVASHDRVALIHRRWFNNVDNHTLHHYFSKCNYGQFFTFWDRIMGTFRDPKEELRKGSVPHGVIR